MLVRNGAVAVLESVLGSKDEEYVREACWVLANLAACGREFIDILLKEGIFRHVGLLLKGGQTEILREATRMVENAFLLGTEPQLRKTLEACTMEDMVELMGAQDVETQYTVLYSFAMLLGKTRDDLHDDMKLYHEIVGRFETCGGVSRLEGLQTHRNGKVYELAVQIMKEHYGAEEVGIVNFELGTDAKGALYC